jgi:hypothetical protein
MIICCIRQDNRVRNQNKDTKELVLLRLIISVIIFILNENLNNYRPCFMLIV